MELDMMVKEAVLMHIFETGGKKSKGQLNSQESSENLPLIRCMCPVCVYLVCDCGR